VKKESFKGEGTVVYETLIITGAVAGKRKQGRMGKGTRQKAGEGIMRTGEKTER